MIDFQSGGLESQVYELIAKICNLACSDDFPHFQTSQTENGRWECKLSIPGVKSVSIGHGSSEVESINQCALKMLMILKVNHPNDDFDPVEEDSLFRSNIEQFFGDVDYDSKYNYHLYETDVLLDSDDYVAHSLERIGSFRIKDEEEIDRMSEIVTIRFLIKTKKNNYC